jgi:hypothetical protein
MKLTKRQAWPIVQGAFPEYKGRKFTLVFHETPYICDTNWGEGTRNQYKLVKLGSDFECRALPTFSPWANPIEGERFPMRPGYALIEHSIFCGKDCGITIYAHPADETKALAR